MHKRNHWAAFFALASGAVLAGCGNSPATAKNPDTGPPAVNADGASTGLRTCDGSYGSCDDAPIVYDGAAIPPDGRTTAVPDGATIPPDGRTTVVFDPGPIVAADGGSISPDGRAVVAFDGGSTSPDGGAVPSDGGMFPGCGGTCPSSGQCGASCPYCVNQLCTSSCGEQGSGCMDDDGCCSGACSRGRCIAKSCESSTVCAGSTTACCTSRPYCVNERCSQSCGAIGARCNITPDCCSGNACVDGLCAGVSCTTKTPCYDMPRACCPSYPYCVERTCSENCGGHAAECNTSSDCCSGYRCSNRLCTSTTCLADGTFCLSDSECCGGSCNNSGCGTGCSTTGAACTDNHQCCNGYSCLSVRGKKVCLSSMCLAGLSPCLPSFPDECCSGQCSDLGSPDGYVCTSSNCVPSGGGCGKSLECCSGICFATGHCG